MIFISHSKEKVITRPDGTSYTKITPTVSDSINNIVRNMSDLQGYGYQEESTGDRYMILRSTPTVEAKSRFPYMEAKIPFGYESLTEALNRAINKEEEINGANAVTDKKIQYVQVKEIDFDALVEEFNSIINGLIQNNTEADFVQTWQPRITQITDKYLGTGKKVSQCSPRQAEQIELIVDELKEMVG